MYYKDLSKYCYGHRDQKENSYNVGWLDHNHSYKKGKVREQFLDKLWGYFSYPVHIYRGFHNCQLCEKQEQGIPLIVYKGETRKAGFYEIRVFDSEGNSYAAPSLIFHYITCHNYLPPQEFVDAVESENVSCQEYYERILKYSDGDDFWLREDRTLAGR